MLPAAETLTLSNGLRVNILHDPQASRTAALIHLNAGSHHEPEEFPGLAHLFEHVVFAGSHQFQGDDRLMMWAQAQGARLNATTHATSTAWFFDMTPAKFEDGLARLTDMLVQPLLTTDTVQQEVAVIDAEYRMLTAHADSLCDAALSLAFAAPAQLHDFHIGHRTAFGEDISALQQALIHYHQRFFTAGQLTLWLQGPQSVAELAALAGRYGNAFAAGKGSPPAHTQPPALSRERYLQLRLESSPRLRFSFPVTLSPALTLLRQLLTDEAPGSLLEQLRTQALADSVRVSLPYTDTTHAILSIEFLVCDTPLALRAGVETLFCHWLQQVRDLSTGHLQHYVALARRDFSRLTPLEQLRARTLDFPPAAQNGWQKLLSELKPENMTRLWIARDVHGHNASVQGFTLPVSFSAWQSKSDSVTESHFMFYLPHAEEAHTADESIQTTGAPLTLLQACIARASLRALCALSAHQGNSLIFSYEQGNGLLQLSGCQAWTARTLAAALRLLRAPSPAALAQGRRLFEQEQRQLRSDIAIRTLLATLPEVVSESSGEVHELRVAGDDAAVLVFCPLAENTAECLAATQILAYLLEPKFFRQLRVEKNIGYVVSCRFHQTARQSGILFALQSPSYDTETLLGFIDTFIAEIPSVIDGITPQTLEEKRCTLRESLSVRPADRLEAARQQWLREFACAPEINEASVAAITTEQLLACVRAPDNSLPCTGEGLSGVLQKNQEVDVGFGHRFVLKTPSPPPPSQGEE
ncbi:pyrroloquinoline quinone biosynthesis protein PqqF [Rahnella sp. SL6]|uniref:pyrroloquinoline quinone biosynthesis protein PqqF n=1 Tax=Rahnella perminowiae TaxID=2816244 RepID=UPI001C27B70B|nr:pyrroloquinoline quinone biosynthesis protein PqqF [Rahnella perminowiae]MBU9810744.1 pyrroloquinoline quinone biosynthesis protein PqqF [Rahnella perminowiae]